MQDLQVPTLRTGDRRPPENARQERLRVEWARCLSDVRAAQRLRYRVFVEEGGAQAQTAVLHHELDAFDPWCEHLLVRRCADHEVIGTYRVLTPQSARLKGGLYTDAEFDLSSLLALRPRLLEVGRACVHPDHRTGGAIMMLWHALARFMAERRLDALIGCASVSMRDGGHGAASLWRQLRQAHGVSAGLRVQPRLPLPTDRLDDSRTLEPPPLLKGYLRLGARLLGPPAWDPDFGTADFPVLVTLAELPARYRRHFLGEPTTA